MCSTSLLQHHAFANHTGSAPVMGCSLNSVSEKQKIRSNPLVVTLSGMSCFLIMGSVYGKDYIVICSPQGLLLGFEDLDLWWCLGKFIIQSELGLSLVPKVNTTQHTF